LVQKIKVMKMIKQNKELAGLGALRKKLGLSQEQMAVQLLQVWNSLLVLTGTAAD